MKKVFILGSFLASLTVSAQNNAEDTIAGPAITAIGKPDGEKNSITIDKEGGRLISADKKIELVFPEGAITTKTTITIQPVTNTSIDGIGKGYDLEPAGTQFQIPVQLIFHYTDKDMEDGSPQLMAIASQNEKGIWYVLTEIKLDTVSKTIAGNIKHFSAWAMTWGFSLRPEKTRVKVSKTVDILAIPKPIDAENKDQKLEVYHGIFGPNAENPIGWYANLVLNGDADNGTFGNSSYPLLTWRETYKAPAKVPSRNPVEIMLAIVGAENGMDGTKGTLFRRCYIEVYDDDYEVKMVSVIIAGGPETWGGTATHKDEGSFIVSLQKDKAALINIKNQMEVMTDNCKNVLLNPNSNTGLLHVAGAKQIKVTPANPPDQPYPIVEIWFVQTRMEFSKVRYDCPPPKGYTQGNATGNTSEMPALGYAFPQYLKFIARDGEQIIIESPKGSDDGYLKVWVKKIKDD
jgi:hypothetical protein